MSKTVSLLSALLCTFIWGTTFIAQDTGMDDIGPFTFNAVRFLVGFLAIMAEETIRPLPIWVQAGLMRGGIAILIGLTLFLVVADVMRLIAD